MQIITACYANLKEMVKLSFTATMNYASINFDLNDVSMRTVILLINRALYYICIKLD